jgi:pyruvate,water dikinase
MRAANQKSTRETAYTLSFEEVSKADLPKVGGKNASLGEMIANLTAAGIQVPRGFAITVDAYREFLRYNELEDRIRRLLKQASGGDSALVEAGQKIRKLVCAAEIPPDLCEDIAESYEAICRSAGRDDLPVAVRSSATSEDLPDASFAGQQDTYLYVRGRDSLLEHCRRCFASLFTDRAIAYRAEIGLGGELPAMSVGVQQMVQSDKGAAGVAFSLDPETGFLNNVVISAAWGLGETVVQGAVNPDEYVVFKPFLDSQGQPIVSRTLGAKQQMMVCREAAGQTAPTIVDTPKRDAARFCLNDDQIVRLARWVTAIEAHYGHPVDTEWALDGVTGELHIVQARPETVHSRKAGSGIKTYSLGRHGGKLAEGVAIGDGAASGVARRLDSSADAGRLAEGEILLAEMTDPNWLPAMRKAAAIVTDRGGRTSHAAIVSRELGKPAITGTADGTRRIRDGQVVTVACCEGAVGKVYDGEAEISVEDLDLGDLPETRTQVMLNLADPASALRWWRLPSDGVGLARMEFIISNHIGVHPLALTRFAGLADPELRRDISQATDGYDDKAAFFVERLASGIAGIAASVWPKPVILRTSDFKSNEYADLLGGRLFEPEEENPMIGWRGAARYVHPDFAEAFALECQAIDQVRRVQGFKNVKVMVPFCRTPDEAVQIVELLAAQGLVQGQDGLEIYAMCEVPSNVLLIDRFAEIFDGFSIGSNDLTQLILGVDRESERLSSIFDESNIAVRSAIESVIAGAHARGRKVGICGQGPSDSPAFARFLASAGIDSVSVTPDSFARVKQNVSQVEGGSLRRGTLAAE